MKIKLIKKDKGDNRIQFQNLQIGEWFEYDKQVYIKIRPFNENHNSLNLSKEGVLKTFFEPSTLCKIIEGELTYWEKE